MIALLDAQCGVLSRDQLLRLGVSDRVIHRLVRGGWLHILERGIYTRGGTLPWLGRAWAGVLLGGDDAVLGGSAAAFLHDLEKAEPSTIEVHTPRQRRPLTGYTFSRAVRQGVGEPPRTTFEATVLDLCADRDEDELAALLADAVSGRRTNPKRLLTEIARRSRVPNRALLCQMLGQVAAGSHSALERRYLVDVETPHGLPTATRQAGPHAAHRGDAWYEPYGVMVELDSRLYHSGGAAFRDQNRDNDHTLMGIITLRFGWADVTGIAVCHTAQVVADALTGRGWAGPPSTCRRCARVHDI